jgi:hypothetical protein
MNPQQVADIAQDAAEWTLGRGECLYMAVHGDTWQIIAGRDGCQPAGSLCLLTWEDVETIDGGHGEFPTVESLCLAQIEQWIDDLNA